jgi:hypothetical protein
MMLDRSGHISTLKRLLRDYPVVAILDARQVGKTTLARELAKSQRRPVATFDLEDPAALARLQYPALALAPLKGLVVLDELQWRPELIQTRSCQPGRRPTPINAVDAIGRTPSTPSRSPRLRNSAATTARCETDREFHIGRMPK